jgi:hypothetical protein
MKKISSKVIMLLSILLLQTSFSQTLTVSNVKVDNLSIPASSPINMRTNSQVNIKFRVAFNKNMGLAIGEVSLLIGTTNSSGIFKRLREPQVYTVVTNNTGDYADYSYDIYAADYDFGEGCKLKASIKQTTGNQLEWFSNEIKIIKFPTYTGIEQLPATISCGSYAPVKYYVSSNDNAGYSTVNFTFGSGWDPNFSSNGLALNVTPLTFPLGIITATPTIHGVVQQTFTFMPNLAPLVSTATISGNPITCPNSNSIYNISNLGTGNTVSWSTSNPAVATVSNGTQSQVQVNGIADGIVDLRATITNPCGQTTVIPLTLNIGAPVIASSSFISGPANVNFNQTVTYRYNGTIPAGASSTYQWFIDG